MKKRRQELRDIRNALGLSLEELSEATKISVSQLSRFESGSREPRVGEAVLLAEKLKVQVSDLFPELRANYNEWAHGFLEGRQKDELERIKATLEAAFPRDKKTGTGE